MDDVAWGALALTVTLLAGLYTWTRARAQGARSLSRWSGITLLPLAAYLTHTLRLMGRIGSAIAHWATGFVWSPVVWLGLILAVVAFALIGLSARLSNKAAPAAPAARGLKARRSARTAGGADTGLGEALDEVEAILKRHGIG